MNWLLLRPDRAGDALKTLPALRALLAQTQATVSLLASSHNFSLFELEPRLKTYRLPAHWNELSPELILKELEVQNFPNVFDSALNLLCDPFENADRLLALIPAKKKFAAGWKTKPEWEDFRKISLPGGSPAERDESLNIALLIDGAFQMHTANSLENVDRAPLLSPTDKKEAEEKMGEKLGRWLGFCPFAGTTQRTHPLKTWGHFLRWVTDHSPFDRFFLFGGREHFEDLQKMRSRCKKREQIEICLPSSFRALGAYLLRLEAVVAVDSGPLHFAQALKVPALGFLSGGDATRWFAHPNPKDLLLKRGLVTRYPTSPEMIRTFRKFEMQLSLEQNMVK